MSTERFKVLSAVYLLLINKNKEVAMIRRFNTGYQDGNYTLPSGHIDEGETASMAMLREAKEEVNVTINKDDLKFVHVIHRNSIDRVYIDFYFFADKWEGDVINLETDKCDNLTWFKISNLPKNIIPDVKLVIESFNKDIHYTEYGW